MNYHCDRCGYSEADVNGENCAYCELQCVYVVLRQIPTDIGSEFKIYRVYSSQEVASQELAKLQGKIAEAKALWDEGQAQYRKALEERGLERYGLVTKEMDALWKEAMASYDKHPNRNFAHDYNPVIEAHELS